MIPDDPSHNRSADRAKGAAPSLWLYLSFGLAALWIVVVAGLVNRNLGVMAECVARSNRAGDVVEALRTLVASVAEARRAAYAYGLTGDAAAVADVPREANQAFAELGRLRTLLEGDGAQQLRLKLLATAIADDLKDVQRVVAVRRDRGSPSLAASPRPSNAAVARTPAAADALALAERQTIAAEEQQLLQGGEVADTIVWLGGMVATGSLLVALVAIRRDWNGRRRGQDALRRSEESLAVTLRSIGDAVLTADTDGKVTGVNEAAERLTGWREAEAVGRPIEDVFQLREDDSSVSKVTLAREVLATGQTHRPANPRRLLARDGSEHFIAENAAPMRDRRGRAIGVVLVLRDLSAERVAASKISAANQAVAAEKSRFEFVFGAAPVGISYVWTAPDGRRSRIINDAHLRLCGMTREEADDPQGFVRVTHPDDRAEQARLGALMETGAIDRFTVDKRYQRQNEEVVWAMLTAERRRHPDGSYEDLSVAVDITKRKEAEVELERFFTVSLDFLTIAGSDGYFKRVNPAVTDVLGWSIDEFLARPYREFVHPDDRGPTQREVERQIRSGRSVLRFENRYRHKNGSWRVLEWRSVPHPDGLTYGAARDVTESRKAEVEIRRLNDSLRERAAQSEAVNKELEAFSYSVSHDLRAPLRHIQGYLGMLEREMPPRSDLTQRYLDTIGAAAREMGELIDDLLLFSRMGRAEMHVGEVELGPLIDEVRADLELTVRDRNIRWTVHPLPSVRGDRSMLKQVLANLLGNAVKYTRPRDPAEIEIGVGGTENGRLVFYVRDNGVGFDMAYADKLFGVFQRLHRADEFEGTGVGLANVQRVVVRHGGRVWAQAQLNAGATFFFTLERTDATAASSEPA